MDRIESIYRAARDDSDISCQITCGQLYRETYYTTQLYRRLIHLDIRGRQMKKTRKRRPYLSLFNKSDTK